MFADVFRLPEVDFVPAMTLPRLVAILMTSAALGALVLLSIAISESGLLGRRQHNFSNKDRLIPNQDLSGSEEGNIQKASQKKSATVQKISRVYPVPVSADEENYLPRGEHASDVAFMMEELENITTLLEFGLGGFTYQANLQTGIRKIFTIEGSQDFTDRTLAKYPSLMWSVEHKRLKILVPRYGPLGKRSNPKDESHKSEWPNYPKTVLWIPANERKQIDFAYIAGRFRVASTMMVLMNTDVQRIVIDNYMTRLNDYQIVEKFLQRVKTGFAAALFKRKLDLNIKEMKAVFDAYQYVPQ